ncbi:MAG: hypothetical protein AAGI46_14130, partial [Planctomycetota bacterium]
VSGASTVNVDADFFVGGEVGAVAGDGSVTVTDGSSVTVGDDLYIGTDISTGVLSLFGAGTTLTVGDRLYVGWGFAGFPATGTLEVGRGAVVEATAGEGLNYADAGGDQATGRFVIGDDGTGTVSSGLIEASTFGFGTGTAMLELAVDGGVVLDVGDVFVLIDYNTWDGGLFANVADDEIVSFSGFQFLIDYNDAAFGGTALTATVIPEPLAALGGFAGVALIGLRRRAKV